MASLRPGEETINDLNNDNPVVGLNGLWSLEDRFKYRLSRMLGRPVSASQANRSKSSLDIYVGSDGSTTTATGDKQISDFTDDLQKSLRNIANGSAKDEATQELWDVVLLFVSPDIHITILDLQQVFANQGKKFDALVTQTCGLDDIDEVGSSLDTALGDSIIRLQQLSSSYIGTVKQQNELIEFAWHIIQRCNALDVRLNYLLGSTFAQELYELICLLTRPLNTLHTFTRAASTSMVFRAVSFHIGEQLPQLKAGSSSPKTIPSPQRTHIPRLRQPHSPPRSLIVPRRRISPPKGNIIDTIRPYLLEEDRGLDVFQLKPASKQETAILIGCILHNSPVPPGSETYYVFGFAACHNAQEVQDLANAYQDLLDTTLDHATVFQSLIRALEYNTLPGLLSNKTPHHIHNSFPAVHNFLRLAPEQRFSVHRLVQFIRNTDTDEPQPCLKRDYGFKLCRQREDVVKLKQLYVSVIEKARAGQLHYACIHGRLREFAVATLGSVGAGVGRLLQNDYPSSWVGFDGPGGCEGLSQPLFKRSLR